MSSESILMNPAPGSPTTVDNVMVVVVAVIVPLKVELVGDRTPDNLWTKT
jgi:hypothetical protein